MKKINMKKINLKINVKKIDTEKFRSPPVVFIFYLLASCLLIMGFRFIFPGEASPLPYFSRNWRLLRGLIDVLSLFPALALSALVVPFGMIHESPEIYGSFSPKFFDRLNGPVTVAICSAILYSLVCFLAMPLARDYEENLYYKAELYRLAKERAETHRKTGEWLEVMQFIGIAESVWDNSPELTAIKTEASIYFEENRYREAAEHEAARTALTADLRDAALSGLPDQRQPVDAADAIALGEEAFAAERYYDAHWFATLGTRLARQGSIEEANAIRLSGRVWNRIESLQPNRLEREIHSLYQLKVSGYEAMISGDWIRAYYIFQELVERSPDDPDAMNYFIASERGTKETSFFIDEMELSLGHNLTGALFSLPTRNRNGTAGRAVLRFSSLSTAGDYAYGTGFEYMGFSGDARQLVRVRAPYVKLLPVTLDGQRKVLVLMRALDRRDEKQRWEAEWNYDGEAAYRTGDAQIVLETSFEDFLVLFRIQRGLPNLSMAELFSTSKTLGDMGYVPQAFDSEILNRLGTVLFFLPMTIFALVIGWRYRAKNRPRYLFIPMLPVLPLVFNGITHLFQIIFGNLGIWLTLSLGFVWALVIFIAAMVLFFVLSLIILAAQKG